jgi:hypothetical protein
MIYYSAEKKCNYQTKRDDNVLQLYIQLYYQSNLWMARSISCGLGNHIRFYLSCLDPLVYLLPMTYIVFDFSIYWRWASPDRGLSWNASCALNCFSTFLFLQSLRWYHTLQGDNSLRSVERFDHMMFVCRFQASRWSKSQREKLLCG